MGRLKMRFKDTKLDEILASNPFNSIVGTWRDTCKKIVGNREDRFDDFILPDDVDGVNEYNDSMKDDSKKIIKHIIPQPYVGNPEAPIWLLYINPGYHDEDEYGLRNASVDNHRTAERFWNQLIPYNENIEWRYLAKRQKMILDQLDFSFEEGCENYFMHPDFYGENMLRELLDENTFDDYKRRNKTFLNIGSKYWKKHLFGPAENGYFLSAISDNIMDVMNKNVFILEMYPYHSKNFNKVLFDKNKFRSKYLVFWKKLVNYALDSNKIIISRSVCSIINLLKEGSNAEEVERKCIGRMLFIKNSQSAHVTTNSLVPYLPLSNIMSDNLELYLDSICGTRDTFKNLQS